MSMLVPTALSVRGITATGWCFVIIYFFHLKISISDFKLNNNNELLQ